MKVILQKITLTVMSLGFFINFNASAMDKPGVVPLQKISDFLKDKKDNKNSDYSQLSVLDIE